MSLTLGWFLTKQVEIFAAFTNKKDFRMLEVFNLALVTSVLFVCRVNGASISQARFDTIGMQQEANINTAPNLTYTPIWKNASSPIYVGWEHFKWVFEAVTNKTFQTIDGLVSNRVQSDPPPEIIQITEKTPATEPLTPSPKGQDVEQKHLNSTHRLPETNTTKIPECDEAVGCVTWKVLKIVGAAVGAGFLVGLITPVLFYFTIIIIGCILYGKLSYE